MEIKLCDFVLSTLLQPIFCIIKENKINLSRVAVIYLFCSASFFFSDAKYLLRQFRQDKITQSNFHPQLVWVKTYTVYRILDYSITARLNSDWSVYGWIQIVPLMTHSILHWIMTHKRIWLYFFVVCLVDTWNSPHMVVTHFSLQYWVVSPGDRKYWLFLHFLSTFSIEINCPSLSNKTRHDFCIWSRTG